MGLTESEAQKQGIAIEKAAFPGPRAGARSPPARRRITKLIFEKDTRRLLGAALVGGKRGRLIAETVLALEMGADSGRHRADDPSPSELSETVFFAAEIAEGRITDPTCPRSRVAWNRRAACLYSGDARP